MALQKSKRTSPPTWLRRHKFYTTLIIVALAVGGYFAYSAYADWQNKRDFQQARSAIDTIYSDVVSKIGQPDNLKRISNCTRSYQEFTGYGNTTCHLDDVFIYGVSGEVEANSMFKRTQNVVSKHKDLFKASKAASDSITDTLVVNTYYHAASDEYTSHSLKCVVNYVFDTPREIELTIKDTSKKPFEITIGCYGPARGLYYPLAY